MHQLRHGSLFSGIGGFDLAASCLNWHNVFQVEIDKFCTKVLAKHFPETKRFSDIKEFDGRQFEGQIDVLSGGFPCQPFSIVGNRKGKQDQRYLFPEMLRVIGEIKPTWIVAENVPGILSMAADEVYVALENEGYQTDVYAIPAIACGATHYRNRVWFVSYANRERCQKKPQKTEHKEFSITGKFCCEQLQVWNQQMPSLTDSCGVADGVSNRLDRLRSLGNAIVPQVAYQIFKCIEGVENERTNLA